MAVYTTIDNPELYFQAKLWTGDGSDGRSITLDGDTDMQPDLVWIKRRDTAYGHSIFDSIRGINKWLSSNETTAELTDPGQGDLASFDSDGFAVTSGGSGDGNVNDNTKTYVAWNWKESATAGFDIVSYTGNGSARTISHSLSAVPKMMIFRNLTNSTAAWSWGVYHVSNTATHSMHLNDTEAKEDTSVPYNDTEPTTSVFSVGTWGGTNYNTDAMIAYCFAPKQGFSSMGSYIGNGNVSGPMIWTGMKPAYFMTKRTDSANSWVIFDNKRDPHNEVVNHLSADSSDANEAGTADSDVDFLSNGVKIREDNNGVNASGGTYVYMAFAEAPFVNSNGVPCNAR